MGLSRATALIGAFGPIMLAVSYPSSATGEWSPHVTLASDLVHRGLSETSGKAALSLGLDWTGGRWFAGGRLANAQLPGPVNPTSDQGQSLALYGGSSWAINQLWSTQWLVSHYEFFGPTTHQALDGYSELSLSLAGERFSVELILAPDAWGESGLTHYAAINWQQPLSDILGGTLADVPLDRFDVDLALGYADAGASLHWVYHYAELGISYSYEHWALDARLHALDDRRVNRRGWSAPRSRLAISLSYFWR